jgi:hypothetical protein
VKLTIPSKRLSVLTTFIRSNERPVQVFTGSDGALAIKDALLMMLEGPMVFAAAADF